MKILNVSPSEFHENEIVWKEGDLFLFGVFSFSLFFHSLTSPICYLVWSDSSFFLAKVGITFCMGNYLLIPFVVA